MIFWSSYFEHMSFDRFVFLHCSTPRMFLISEASKHICNTPSNNFTSTPMIIFVLDVVFLSILPKIQSNSLAQWVSTQNCFSVSLSFVQSFSNCSVSGFCYAKMKDVDNTPSSTQTKQQHVYLPPIFLRLGISLLFSSLLNSFKTFHEDARAFFLKELI